MLLPSGLHRLGWCARSANRDVPAPAAEAGAWTKVTSDEAGGGDSEV
jgi:hypothetical protein